MKRPAAATGPLLGACWVLSACTAPALRAVPAHRGPVSALALGRDGTVWSCSQTGILATAPGRVDPVVVPAPFRPFALARVERLDALVVAGGTPGRSGRLAIVQPDGGVLHSLRVADDVVYAVAVDSEGRFAAAAGADGRLFWCELQGGSDMTVEARNAHAGPCRAVAFAPHDELLVSCGRDGSILVWGPGSRPATPLRGHTSGVECLAFSTDGTRVASGALDGRVRLHSLDGRLLRSWHRLGAPVQAIAAGEGGFFAGLADGRVLFLDPRREDAEEIARFTDPVHAIVERDGELLVGLRGRVVRLPVRPETFGWQHRCPGQQSPPYDAHRRLRRSPRATPPRHTA